MPIRYISQLSSLKVGACLFALPGASYLGIYHLKNRRQPNRFLGDKLKVDRSKREAGELDDQLDPKVEEAGTIDISKIVGEKSKNFDFNKEINKRLIKVSWEGNEVSEISIKLDSGDEKMYVVNENFEHTTPLENLLRNYRTIGFKSKIDQINGLYKKLGEIQFVLKTYKLCSEPVAFTERDGKSFLDCEIKESTISLKDYFQEEYRGYAAHTLLSLVPFVSAGKFGKCETCKRTQIGERANTYEIKEVVEHTDMLNNMDNATSPKVVWQNAFQEQEDFLKYWTLKTLELIKTYKLDFSDVISPIRQSNSYINVKMGEADATKQQSLIGEIVGEKSKNFDFKEINKRLITASWVGSEMTWFSVSSGSGSEKELYIVNESFENTTPLENLLENYRTIGFKNKKTQIDEFYKGEKWDNFQFTLKTYGLCSKLNDSTEENKSFLACDLKESNITLKDYFQEKYKGHAIHTLLSLIPFVSSGKFDECEKCENSEGVHMYEIKEVVEHTDMLNNMDNATSPKVVWQNAFQEQEDFLKYWILKTEELIKTDRLDFSDVISPIRRSDNYINKQMEEANVERQPNLGTISVSKKGGETIYITNEDFGYLLIRHIPNGSYNIPS